MKNTVDRLISRLDTAEEKLSTPEDIEILEVNRNFQNIKTKRKGLGKKRTKYPSTVEQLQKVSHMKNGNYRKKTKRERNRRNIFNNND